MKKWIIGLGVLVALLAISFSIYNGIVTKQETVTARIGDVQSQYQRRSDLIPNLVTTVEGYAKHEKDVFIDVTEARAEATQVTMEVNPEQLAANPQLLQDMMAKQGAVSYSLGRLIAISENYPNLKSNENFLTLQAQLEGTENRISVARGDMNDAINAYNTSIRTFPGSLFAGLCGCKKFDYYEASTPGADKAPTVSFN